jgi:hypothetical protein
MNVRKVRHRLFHRRNQVSADREQARGTLTASSLPQAALLMASNSTLLGCSYTGAPSFNLFGAFFPAWMLCALIAIVAALTARVVLSTPRFADTLPLPLAVCTAVGVIVGLFTWIVLFR